MPTYRSILPKSGICTVFNNSGFHGTGGFSNILRLTKSASNEVYYILRLTVEMLADDMRITCRMTGESGSLISMGDWITEFRLQFVMPMVT